MFCLIPHSRIPPSSDRFDHQIMKSLAYFEYSQRTQLQLWGKVSLDELRSPSCMSNKQMAPPNSYTFASLL